jgi:N-methylhydantoinase A
LGNGASTLSAYGAAVGDLIRSFERPVSLASPFDPDALGGAVAALEDQVRTAMAGTDLAGRLAIERVASMRYGGQKLQELNVRLPDAPIDGPLCAEMERRFTAEYARLYSKAALALFQSIEIFAVRVTARVLSPVAAPVAAERAPGSTVQPHLTRDVYWPGLGRRATKILRGMPQLGAWIEGPAIVELHDTSVAAAPSQSLVTDVYGSLILEL